MAYLTPEDRSQIRANIDETAIAANPLTCRAILSLLDECEDLKRKLDSQRNRINEAHRKFHEWGNTKGDGFDVQHAPQMEFEPAALMQLIIEWYEDRLRYPGEE